MKCPVCDDRPTLRLAESPGGVKLRECPGCGGRWIRSDDYWRWRARGAVAPPPDEDAAWPTGEDTDDELRFCPEDGYVLARFDVGPPHDFKIDQCRNCSGVWLDRGEWTALVRTGLSDRMHLILSEEWQEEIRKAGRADREREQWRRQLGDDDLEKISDIKRWLDGHPRRSELYAYLRLHERAV